MKLLNKAYCFYVLTLQEKCFYILKVFPKQGLSNMMFSGESNSKNYKAYTFLIRILRPAIAYMYSGKTYYWISKYVPGQSHGLPSWHVPTAHASMHAYNYKAFAFALSRLQ